MKRLLSLVLIFILFFTMTSTAIQEDYEIKPPTRYFRLSPKRLEFIGDFEAGFLQSLDDETWDEIEKEALNKQESSGYWDLVDTTLHLLGEKYPGKSTRYPREETAKQLALSPSKKGEVTARFEDQRMLLRENLLTDEEGMKEQDEEVKKIIDQIPDDLIRKYKIDGINYFFNSTLPIYSYGRLDEWAMARALADYPELQIYLIEEKLYHLYQTYFFSRYKDSSQESSEDGEFGFYGMKEELSHLVEEELFHKKTSSEIIDAYYKASLEDNALENFRNYLQEVSYGD
ncbi:MAG: hypothetical protein Q4P28_05730 [Tissierellia bacterium]|nr:hypothetical protein [Tissierellia bacterium]